MAEVDEKLLDGEEQEQAESPVDETEASGGAKFSFVKIGIPVLLVQIVVAYFLAYHLLVPQFYGDSSANAALADSVDINEEADEIEFGKIYTVEDVIVNPKDSGGAQFVLINFGFEVKEEDDVVIMGDRQIQVRDILIKIISSRTMPELDGPDDKESLRREVFGRVGDILPRGHLMNVYFSNYIIQ